MELNVHFFHLPPFRIPTLWLTMPFQDLWCGWSYYCLLNYFSVRSCRFHGQSYSKSDRSNTGPWLRISCFIRCRRAQALYLTALVIPELWHYIQSRDLAIRDFMIVSSHTFYFSSFAVAELRLKNNGVQGYVWKAGCRWEVDSKSVPSTIVLIWYCCIREM
jgi:hypothetical protein